MKYDGHSMFGLFYIWVILFPSEIVKEYSKTSDGIGPLSNFAFRDVSVISGKHLNCLIMY